MFPRALSQYNPHSAPSNEVRVSGGHLCEAEAPTEPAGEKAVSEAKD